MIQPLQFPLSITPKLSSVIQIDSIQYLNVFDISSTSLKGLGDKV
jgi:hypothetical protein